MYEFEHDFKSAWLYEEQISKHYSDYIDGQFSDVSVSEINNNDIFSNEEGTDGFAEENKLLEEAPESAAKGRDEGRGEIGNKEEANNNDLHDGLEGE